MSSLDLSFGAQLPSDHNCYLLVRTGYKHTRCLFAYPIMPAIHDDAFLERLIACGDYQTIISAEVLA